MKPIAEIIRPYKIYTKSIRPKQYEPHDKDDYLSMEVIILTVFNNLHIARYNYKIKKWEIQITENEWKIYKIGYRFVWMYALNIFTDKEILKYLDSSFMSNLRTNFDLDNIS